MPSASCLGRQRICCQGSVVVISTHNISKISNLESILWQPLIAYDIRAFVSIDGSLDHTTYGCVPFIVCVERPKVRRCRRAKSDILVFLDSSHRFWGTRAFASHPRATSDDPLRPPSAPRNRWATLDLLRRTGGSRGHNSTSLLPRREQYRLLAKKEKRKVARLGNFTLGQIARAVSGRLPRQADNKRDHYHARMNICVDLV